METERKLPRLPFERRNPLDLAPMYRILLTTEPIARVRTPAGDVAWLVTRYDYVKQLFSDERLGRSHPDPDNAPRITHAALAGGPIGDDLAEENAGHSRMRRLLTPAFTSRRMRAMRERTDALVAGLLDDMQAHGAPVDLHERLSFPLPMLVICGLLGVPYTDSGQFEKWAQGLANWRDGERAAQCWEQLTAYMRELIARKRAEPGEDVVTDLIGADGDEPVTDEEIAGICAGVLFAGHETTVARIDFGTLLLLDRPDQVALMGRDPEVVASAVEEILRLVTPASSGGQTRYAHDDVRIGGVTIRAGEAVLLAENAANRDENVFPEPDRFDVTRTPNPHLAFGHGPRYCIGAALARVELHAVFSVLFHRFPRLSLDIPFNELRVRDDLFTGGLVELPVRW